MTLEVPVFGERGRLALAAGAGLLLASAFPTVGLAGAAFVAPGLMLMAALGSAHPFRAGYVAGLCFHLAALHWLLYIPVRFYPILGWLALSAYVALYPACWCWLGASAFRLWGVAEGGFLRRAGWALGCAVCWVAVEMMQARLLSGFPWNLLGSSQYKMLPLIQAAAVTGVYGVSCVVAWVSVGLALGAWRLMRQPADRYGWVADTLPPLGAALLCVVAGWQRLQTWPVPEGRLPVALVQPSIPQTMIWNAEDSDRRFQQVLRLSELALATRPALLIWPEAATPKLLRYDRDIYEAVTNLVRTHQVWLLLGADDAQPRGPNDADYYNSSFLVSPEGAIVASYRKRQLVVFGEYIPLARWLPFLQWFTPIEGGFTPGAEATRFLLPDLGVKTATLICFEDIFPHLAREYVDADSDFLVNLTNDGWFGESAAHWQQAASAVFRAVENGLPLVRCANNGLTCWVDALGGLHEVWFGDSRDIYGAGFKTARIPIRGNGPPRPATFYQRRGDVFGWACVVLAALELAAVAWAGWRRGRPQPRRPAAPDQAA